jgi:GNAT superfamily N-acetyltransferase
MSIVTLSISPPLKSQPLAQFHKIIMSQPPTFSLAPVERQDIPQLAQIYTLVTLLDNALKLNYSTPTLCAQSITTLLQTQLGDPAWLHIKVVDKATNTIAAWASWVTVAETVKVGEEYAKGLDGYVQQEMDKLLVEWTKGERYMRCKACFVLPEFQRRGMGKALVGCGNEIADRERLPIFLLASPVVSAIFTFIFLN